MLKIRRAFDPCPNYYSVYNLALRWKSAEHRVEGLRILVSAEMIRVHDARPAASYFESRQLRTVLNRVQKPFDFDAKLAKMTTWQATD